MRFTCLLVVVLSLSSVTACSIDADEDLEKPKGRTSAIVFGVTQRTDPATGKTLTTAGHEYLFLGWESVSFGPWAASRQSLPDGWCRRLETTSDSTRPHVGDGGRAHFAGGAIGAIGESGIVLDANGPDPIRDGAAFDPQKPMTFRVDHGFGLPSFDPVEVPPPNAALRLTSPSPDLTEIAIDAGHDLRLEWASREEPEAAVMVAFDADDRSDHVRCWFRERDGTGVVKAEELRGLGKGTLTIASHRNAIVTPGDGWLVEILAIAIASEQRYVVR